MRVLLITARYLPHRGGLESVVYHLARELCADGHQVHIVTGRYPRSLPAYETIEGIPIRRLHFILPEMADLRTGRLDIFLAGIWFQLATAQALRRMLNEFAPEVVNNHYLSIPAVFVSKVMAHQALPWVVSLHGGDVDGEPHRSQAKLRRFRRIARQASRITVCSRSLAEQAVALESGLQGKIEVIHNGVDVSRFAQAAPFTRQRPYILAVGQLVPHKGFDFLLEVFRNVANCCPEVDLLIAGEGEERPRLEACIHTYGLEGRVEMLGKVDEARVASLMAGSLFLVMPSRREPFGIVALEAMASGKRVLAAPVGGLPEFLPATTNRLVSLDVQAWTDTLCEWMALANRGALDAKENQVAARDFDWPQVMQKYLGIYQQVLSQTRVG